MAKIIDSNVTDLSLKSNSRDDKYVIFHVEGGLGKNVLSTAVIANVKKKYPDRKLIVVASWPEVFLNNPNIHRVYRVGLSPYFYNDYVLDKDSVIMKHEPYHESNHINKKHSLIKTWCEMYDLPYDKTDKPRLYYNHVQNFIAQGWMRNKPVLVMQTNGGPMDGQRLNYSWTRDMPHDVQLYIAQKYSQQYHIIQICRDQSEAIPGVEAVYGKMSNMELFSVLRVSQKRILIDSSLQHAAAAFELPSAVLWVGTSPVVFGYDIHKNLIAKPPKGNLKMPDSYLYDYQFQGEPHECPYDSMDGLFNTAEIDRYMQQ